jgi:hypothetical protein
MQASRQQGEKQRFASPARNRGTAETEQLVVSLLAADRPKVLKMGLRSLVPRLKYRDGMVFTVKVHDRTHLKTAVVGVHHSILPSFRKTCYHDELLSDF